ncbi:MAG: MopE-related protein [Myxococcaceae bacterium]
MKGNRAPFPVLLGFVCLFVTACTCNNNKVATKLKPEGDPCAADSECETQFCGKPHDKNICVRKCSDGCKENEICENLGTDADGGERFACVPDVPGLCSACQTDVDCPYPGDRCLALGSEHICGRDCSFNGACPSSYKCADGNDALGGAVQKQCQPNSGTCQCTTISAGMTIPCAATNNLGSCMGVQTCNPPAGYDACSAHIPAPETCNGIDDDCNGMTDENLGNTSCGKGECKRTAENCVNGSPNYCVPGDAGMEVCDGKDNDCDGTVDNGFDLTNDKDNCGMCGNKCQLPHATPICSQSMCKIGMCDMGWANADGIDSNGCEYSCTPTNMGIEICDGLDNNCNGMIDEGFLLASDPNNCGMCNHICNIANGNIATYACNASQCAIGTCNAGFDDCDQQYATGCEQNVASDVNNCGGCNHHCTIPNATPGCAGSMCVVGMCNMGFADCNMTALPDGCEINITNDVNNCSGCGNVCPVPAHSTADCSMATCTYSCLAGYIDLNAQAGDGCEYQCSPTGGSDTPDYPGFVDANCDGIDGELNGAIFVDTVSGLDTNAGTMAKPKKTIMSGINAAAATNPMKQVLVSKGNYNEAVVLHDGVSLFGGYDASNSWHRAVSNVTTINSSTTVGVFGNNLGLALQVQLFTVVSAPASGTAANGDGLSSMAMLFINSSNVTVQGCALYGTNGSDGTGGTTGSVGSDGSTGGNAGIGGVTVQGIGGGSPCGATGGPGGPGVSGTSNGNNGTGGTYAGGGGAGPAGSYGAAGTCSTSSSSSGNPAPPVTSGGGNGSPGANGYAALNFGSIDSTYPYYHPPSGGVGAQGLPGGGAGGGGSGGGAAHGTNVICTNCSNISSGGGGGGGGGACGGFSGTGGRGGGGSFGMVTVSSNITIDTTTFAPLGGGRGGSGGNGGSGGTGGGGGLGSAGQVASNSCSTRNGGAGANGAKGGDGGQGGGASGGTGGPSVCVAYLGTAPTIIGTSPCMFGQPGQGGNGGSNGLQTAPQGTAGITGQLKQSN